MAITTNRDVSVKDLSDQNIRYMVSFANILNECIDMQKKACIKAAEAAKEYLQSGSKRIPTHLAFRARILR